VFVAINKITTTRFGAAKMVFKGQGKNIFFFAVFGGSYATSSDWIANHDQSLMP
jgi:hypothetical protein